MDFSMLRAKLKLAPVEGVDAWWMYSRKTPRHTFTYFLRQVADEHILHLCIRDQFASSDLAAVLEWASANDNWGATCQRAIAKATSYRPASLRFDCLYLLGPTAHASLKDQGEDLHLRTIEFFPGYQCEFSGTESADEIKLMRRDLIETPVWNRSPTPKVKMQYSNPCTGGRSTGRSPGLTSYKSVIAEINNLVGCADAFVEVVNYQEEHLMLRWSRDIGFLTTNAGKDQPVSDAVLAVSRFLGC